MKVVLPFVRTPDNYDRDRASDESGLCCKDPSLTKQSFAEEADINTIVRRFHLTGELPSDLRAPTYADFVGVFDFHTAMNAVAQAGESFDALPAAIRARFHNNPAEFVDFCSDEANRGEAEKLGLVFKKELTDVSSSSSVESRSKEGRENVEGDLEQSGRVDVGAGDSRDARSAGKGSSEERYARGNLRDGGGDKGVARPKGKG